MTAAVSSVPRRIASGVGSLLIAVVLLVGVPVLLWQLAGWPLPTQVPTPEQFGHALSRSSVSDGVIIKTLAVLGWTAWLVLCWSIVVETWAWARGRPAPQMRFAGPLQHVARHLVTTVSLLMVTGTSASVPTPTLTSVEPAVLVAEHDPQPAVVTTTGVPEMSPEPAGPIDPPPAPVTYTVQRRDSLWRIAECQLGDPLRWREIWELNRGRDFGGVRFTDANLIYSGWVLELPPHVDATAPAPPAEPPAPRAVPPPPTPEPESTQAPTTTTAPAPTPTVGSTMTAPPTAPATIAPPTTTSTDTSVSTDRTGADQPAVHGDDEQHRAPLFIGGVALATSLLLILTRLRRSQARRRRPGQPPHRAPTETLPTETALRRTADIPQMRRLTAALRAFAVGIGTSPLPELAAVRVDDAEVEVLFGSPTQTTPPGFEDRGERRAFATESGLSTTSLEGLAADTTAPWPAIVTIGTISDEPVLIDLETAGLFTIDGPDAVEVVRRIAAELTASPVSELIDLVTIGEEFDLAASERITSVPTVDEAIDRLAHSARSTRDALDRLGMGDTPTARRDHSSEQGWGVTVLVSMEPLPDADRQRLVEAVAGRCGVAALLVGEPLTTGWSLTLGPTAHLDPHGFDLEPLPLPAQDLDAVDDLLSDAAVGDTEELLLTDEADSPAPPDTPTAAVYVPSVLTTSPGGSDVDIEVRVLGPVVIHGAEPINRRRTTEIITYLALHPRGLTPDQLKTAIWPEAMPTQDTFNVTIHRARSALGLDREGRHHIPHAVTSDRGYTVGPHVTTDLAIFTDLVVRSRSTADETEEEALLHRALDLLRGPPFDGARGYEWAFTEGTVVEAEAMISDAAHRLAQLALSRGDADTAAWAAMQGLKAVPGSEPLYRDRMEAAHLNGDPAAVDRIVEELCRYIETQDPLDDLHPDTIDLWHRIGRRHHV